MLFQSEADLWTLELVLSLFFLGAFVTLGAFGLYNWGMSRMPASRASVFINLVPVLAVLLGWLVLNEGLNHFQIGADVVVAGGVILSQRKNRKTSAEADPPQLSPVRNGRARPEECPPQ